MAKYNGLTVPVFVLHPKEGCFCMVGNDLARVLRWGPGYGGDEDPLSLLRDVIEADEIRLDRWTVVFRSVQTLILTRQLESHLQVSPNLNPD